jgi:predicted nucleic acid-binding protein
VVEQVLRDGLRAPGPAKRTAVSLPSYDLGPALLDAARPGRLTRPEAEEVIAAGGRRCAVDSGVLVAAANRFAPEHARAADLLESLANGEQPWALPWSAAHEFLAFVTHPHAVGARVGARRSVGVPGRPAPQPDLRLLGPTERHAAVCAEVLESREPGSTGLRARS